MHVAFAATLEADLDGAAPDLATLLLVADHHHRAGDADAAYHAAVRAATMAERVDAWAEAVRLLRRALDLHPRVEGAQEDRSDLWGRVRDAADRGGDLDTELEATETLLERGGLTPVEAAALVVRGQHLRFSTGRGFLDVGELRRAVELSRAEPGSWQHAFALAELTHALLWQDDPEADPVGREALQRARECGHPRALAYALATNAMRAVVEDRPAEGQVLAQEAGRAAAEARDGWAFVHATLWEANSIDTPVSPAWRALVGRRRLELVALGLPHPYEAWLASSEAFGQLHGGSWRACPALLRVALGATPGAFVDVHARLGAAWLAAQQGRVHEAEGHLARADELFTETSTFLAFEFDAVRATVHLAAGRPRAALDAALEGTTTPGAPPTMCEWLLPLAGRALADLAEVERDAGRAPGDLLAELEALVLRFPHVLADLGPTTDVYGRQLAGLDALYRAEVARGRQEPDAPVRWAEATTLLRDVLPWEECYALRRQAESLLHAGATHRDAAADALRRCQALARELEAVPVLEEVAALARTARVPLAEPATPLDATEPAHDRLTAREREVLTHIVAGRTYGEIARALVLSEKTVSSHVSHLLTKTGTANRVDLAGWATRRRPS